MALDATIGGANSNSYLTEAEANAYLTNERLYITAWTAATTTVREQALIWATFLIDASFEFEGSRRYLTQALRFPRAGLVDVDGDYIDQDTIPSLIKKATATYALYLLQGDRTAEPSILGLGIKEAKIGPLSVIVDSLENKPIIPDDIALILAPLGSLTSQASEGSSVVKLDRA
jgi:hypothetical protein